MYKDSSKDEIMSGCDKYLISCKGACLVAGLGFMGAVLPLSFAQEPVPSPKPAGETKTPSTKILEMGARFLQGTQPLKSFDIYLVGFHPMKDHPENQMEAHHYCYQTNEDFAQCMLFDGNTRDANLNGIEYIHFRKTFRHPARRGSTGIPTTVKFLPISSSHQILPIWRKKH